MDLTLLLLLAIIAVGCVGALMAILEGAYEQTQQRREKEAMAFRPVRELAAATSAGAGASGSGLPRASHIPNIYVPHLQTALRQQAQQASTPPRRETAPAESRRTVIPPRFRNEEYRKRHPSAPADGGLPAWASSARLRASMGK